MTTDRPGPLGGATALRALHRAGDPLVLPNIWDVASAQAVAAAGYPAVATSSAAVAATLGYDDGEAMPVEIALHAVSRIVASVDLPVTADVERGYGLDPAELVERLAATGAVGCNLEDSDPATGALLDPQEHADWIAAVRAAALQSGVDLVVNARVDSFIHGHGSPDERFADAVVRTARYVAAGADCVYPILLIEPDAVAAFVAAVPGPVNILARPTPSGTPSPSDLGRLGVARVSYGPGLLAAMKARLTATLTAIRAGADPYRHPAEHEPAPASPATQPAPAGRG